jgi:hypothetical protein
VHLVRDPYRSVNGSNSTCWKRVGSPDECGACVTMQFKND